MQQPGSGAVKEWNPPTAELWICQRGKRGAHRGTGRGRSAVLEGKEQGTGSGRWPRAAAGVGLGEGAS
jgi:hypothetical protein